MSKIDDLIQESLKKEDEALLAGNRLEPGLMPQFWGIFRGPIGWVMWVNAALHTFAFAGVVYSLWALFTAADLMYALRWGVVAILLLQFMAEIGGHFGTRIEANRILRAVNRLELRLVQRDSESD